jgi:hypothetical protein
MGKVLSRHLLPLTLSLSKGERVGRKGERAGLRLLPF